MSDYPIDFSGPMVRAILAGTKTQTRRVVKPQPRQINDDFDGTWEWKLPGRYHDDLVMGTILRDACPYGQPGDKLLVRQAPGASRLTLGVTGLCVERVQEITPEDAKAEGVVPMRLYSDVMRAGHQFDEHLCAFHDLWDRLYAKKGCGWYENPFVWAITFRVVKGEGR